MTSPLKFLVVDDIASARKILIRFLEKLGYTGIEEVGNGQEALNRVKLGGIDFIISDWDMPVMDGMELLQNLHQDKQLSQIPFIMITSSLERDNVVDAAKSGVADYIAKPFSLEILREKIKNVQERQSAKGSNQ